MNQASSQLLDSSRSTHRIHDAHPLYHAFTNMISLSSYSMVNISKDLSSRFMLPTSPRLLSGTTSLVLFPFYVICHRSTQKIWNFLDFITSWTSILLDIIVNLSKPISLCLLLQFSFNIYNYWTCHFLESIFLPSLRIFYNLGQPPFGSTTPVNLQSLGCGNGR